MTFESAPEPPGVTETVPEPGPKYVPKPAPNRVENLGIIRFIQGEKRSFQNLSMSKNPTYHHCMR